MVTLAFREVGQTFGDLTVFSRLSCTIAGGKVTAVTGETAAASPPFCGLRRGSFARRPGRWKRERRGRSFRR